MQIFFYDFEKIMALTATNFMEHIIKDTKTGKVLIT